MNSASRAEVICVDGQPLPKGYGIELETDMASSSAWWTLDLPDAFVAGLSRVERVARVRDGARLTVDGRLVHVEGAAAALRRRTQ